MKKRTFDGRLDEFLAGFRINREWHDNVWNGTERKGAIGDDQYDNQ